jgi:tetratricopeptide (TPR) repeat protein
MRVFIKRLLASGCALLFVSGIASAQAGRVVTVLSEPGASIWVDSVLYGKTDASGSLSIRAIPMGTHTLRVRASGFAERAMPLPPGSKVSVALTKTTDPAELAFQEAERLSLVDRDKAAEAYRKAIKLKPTYLAAHLALARVLMDAGDLEDAQAAVAAARRISPGNAEATAILGRIYKENGEEEKAIAAYKRAVTEGKGTQPEALAGLGLLYKEKAESAAGASDFAAEDANYTESAKYLRSSLKQLGSSSDAMVMYQLLGLIYERQKKSAEAIATYEEFLRLFPDTSEASAVRSFIVQLKKEHPE